MKLTQLTEARPSVIGNIERWIEQVQAISKETISEMFDVYHTELDYLDGEVLVDKLTSPPGAAVELTVLDEDKRWGITQEEARELVEKAWKLTNLPYTDIAQDQYYSEGDEDESFQYHVKYVPVR